MIRENADIKGIQIGEKVHKIKQFADDCTCIVRDIPSIYTLIETIKGFSVLSGLALNIEKSVLFFLGPWKIRTNNVLNMQVEKDAFNLLGIFVGRCKKTLHQNNFERKREIMKKSLFLWSQTFRTLQGKILAAKTFGVSNLIYSLSNANTDISFLNKAQSDINNFIWNYRGHKVKHTTLIRDYDQLGLKHIDLVTQSKALKLTWIGKLLTGHGWNDFANTLFEQYGGLRLILRCNFDEKS